MKFGLVDGLAGGLEAKGILFRSSNFGDPLYGFSHNLQPWARDYLKKHPELLKVEDRDVQEAEGEGGNHA